jgi:hypothetical protein
MPTPDTSNVRRWEEVDRFEKAVLGVYLAMRTINKEWQDRAQLEYKNARAALAVVSENHTAISDDDR